MVAISGFEKHLCLPFGLPQDSPKTVSLALSYFLGDDWISSPPDELQVGDKKHKIDTLSVRNTTGESGLACTHNAIPQSMCPWCEDSRSFPPFPPYKRIKEPITNMLEVEKTDDNTAAFFAGEGRKRRRGKKVCVCIFL